MSEESKPNGVRPAWGITGLAPWFTIIGAAADPAITVYRENTGEIKDRSLPSLLDWAASKGVVVPEYMLILPVDLELKDTAGIAVPAKYCEIRYLVGNERIFSRNPADPYNSIVSPVHDKVVVNVRQQVLANDEEWWHVLAHEVYEVSELKKCFDESEEHSKSATTMYYLTARSPTLKNLHWDAWEYADKILFELRGEK
jgi:hypothetical protein